MTDASELQLQEQLLLLALRDEEGTLEAAAGHVDLGLGGAVLAELLLSGAVSVEGATERARVHSAGPCPPSPVLAAAWRRIDESRRPRTAAHWVGAFAGIRDLRALVAGGLCRQGILQEEERSVLLLFRRRAFPTIDPGPETVLVEAMRATILDDAAPAPRLALLVTLAHAVGLLRVPFRWSELRRRRDRLEEIAALAAASPAADATGAAVRAVTAAIVAATTAATAAAVVVTTS